MKIRSFLLWLFAVHLAAMGGCAAPPALKAFQGHPYAAISGAPKQKVVDQLISIMLSHRYELKHYTFLRDQGYRIEFVKTAPDGAEGFMPSRFLLHGQVPAPLLGVQYDVVEAGDALRISAKVIAANSAPPGTLESINAENHRIQKILGDLKASFGGK